MWGGLGRAGAGWGRWAGLGLPPALCTWLFGGDWAALATRWKWRWRVWRRGDRSPGWRGSREQSPRGAHPHAAPAHLGSESAGTRPRPTRGSRRCPLLGPRWVALERTTGRGVGHSVLRTPASDPCGMQKRPGCHVRGVGEPRAPRGPFGPGIRMEAEGTRAKVSEQPLGSEPRGRGRKKRRSPSEVGGPGRTWQPGALALCPGLGLPPPCWVTWGSY